MLILVVAFLVLAVLVGSAAYLPLPVTVVLGAAIALWLVVFAARERGKHGRTRKG
ncbi:hypothetical protein B046DRAFT_04507 [Streptomyces sp. LamerLS-316]|uniref:hypothetical protein n=1 Tax=unclassified Streptomyces TaxID=2593676 RepID=UPI000823C327|nr:MULTISPECIES: hypothetical protein [unclassified Streptomyces]SCK45122.1 hypothetical protein B046DRAFT_04507 [Streptomyces sp. LamerLS-316]